MLTPGRLAASPVLSDPRGTVTHVTDEGMSSEQVSSEQVSSERVCKDCEGVVTHVTAELLGDAWDTELMCVLCGAALSLGGLLFGELDALMDEVA